ncbi:MAG: hypothetical protein EAX86_12530 [Candidatus Heimdallarchaeota archaeon]|nr:hypothetical protein [Candidatus Heimdallarchaeota archaeon]
MAGFEESYQFWQELLTKTKWASPVFGDTYYVRYPIEVGTKEAQAYRQSLLKHDDTVHAWDATGIRNTIIQRVMATQEYVVRERYSKLTFFIDSLHLLPPMPENELDFILRTSLLSESNDIEGKYLQARKTLLTELDPPESIPSDQPGSVFEKYRLDPEERALKFSKCQIEFYGLLNIIKDHLYVLTDEELIEVVTALLDVEQSDKILVKRFASPNISEENLKPWIGIDNAEVRLKINFLLKYLGGDDPEYYSRRVFILFLYNILQFDPPFRKQLETHKDSFLEEYPPSNYANLIVQVLRFYQLYQHKERLLTLLKNEYTAKSHFKNYASEIIHFIKKRNHLFNILGKDLSLLSVDLEDFQNERLNQFFALSVLESIVRHFGQQIPEPEGMSRQQARLVLNKRRNNLRKQILTMDVQEEVLESFNQLNSLVEEEKEDELIELIKKPYTILVPRAEQFFENLKHEVEEFKRSAGDQDLREEIAGTTDTPQSLLKQYGNEAFRFVDQNPIPVVDYYNSILTLKSNELLFAGIDMLPLRKQAILDSIFKGLYQTQFQFLNILYDQKQNLMLDQFKRENAIEKIELQFGERGIEYLIPQLEIIRQTRNLVTQLENPKNRLISQKFFTSLNMLQTWLTPVIAPIYDDLSELEVHLQELQTKTTLQLKEISGKYWRDIKNDTLLGLQLEEILELKKSIVKRREQLLKLAKRYSVSTAFGLVLWPHTEYRTVSEACKEVETRYLGPNVAYDKNNLYTDSLALTLLGEDLSKQRQRNVDRQLDTIIESRLQFQKIEEQFEWSKYQRDKNDGQFNERQVNTILKELVPEIKNEEKRGMYDIYDSSTDRYPIGQFIEWLNGIIRQRSISTESELSESHDRSHQRQHLIGLSFMDKHRRKEVLGNVEGLENLLEQILAPFHELKQEQVYMKSAQFEIGDVSRLASQAWIYDYSGTSGGILRSTLFLVSDKQPKFDVLEICQQLSNSVLSGRVNRNDIAEGNWIRTNQLPKRVWNGIGSLLITILEELLVYEEPDAVRLIKSIFQDEDKSHLVISKKFVPIFLTEFITEPQLQKSDTIENPDYLNVWGRSGFIYQYRFAQISGYPWYRHVNKSLETLISDYMQVSFTESLYGQQSIFLRQSVFHINEQTYIAYYSQEGDILRTLIFRETNIDDINGIDPVEVIFRPHRFLNREPSQNQLEPLLDRVNAKDPRDLMTFLSGMI